LTGHPKLKVSQQIGDAPMSLSNQQRVLTRRSTVEKDYEVSAASVTSRYRQKRIAPARGPCFLCGEVTKAAPASARCVSCLRVAAEMIRNDLEILMPILFTQCRVAALALIAAVAIQGCGQVDPAATAPTAVPSRGAIPSSNSSPTAPAPAPQPAPAPKPAPAPAPPTSNPTPTPAPAPATGRVDVTINPNPVPFSGQPITDISTCQTRPNTWFYDQVLREVGGVQVTVTQRVDSFDGVAGSPTNPALRIPANGSITVRTRWCSVAATAHTAQSNFFGTDANGKTWSLTGPIVRLLAK
jgi:hypothetical protein